MRHPAGRSADDVVAAEHGAQQLGGLLAAISAQTRCRARRRRDSGLDLASVVAPAGTRWESRSTRKAPRPAAGSSASSISCAVCRQTRQRRDAEQGTFGDVALVGGKHEETPSGGGGSERPAGGPDGFRCAAGACRRRPGGAGAVDPTVTCRVDGRSKGCAAVGWSASGSAAVAASQLHDAARLSSRHEKGPRSAGLLSLRSAGQGAYAPTVSACALYSAMRSKLR